MIYFFGFAVVSFFYGLYRMKGPVSVTYLYLGSIFKGGNYLAFPFSLMFLLSGLALTPLVPDDLKLAVVVIGVASPVLFAYPALIYLKPKWLRWLEQYYQDIIPELELEIQRIGPDVWDKQINTQEELEAWVHAYIKRAGLHWR